MPKKFYIPINELSTEVKKWYIPINGHSVKVIKAYCPVNGLSKCFFEDGGSSIIGFWLYYSTIVEKIIDGKRYTVVPTQIPVEVRKKNRGIAFYFFIQQIEDGNIIENLVFTVSTDSTATPFNGIWGGQTYPFDSVDSTTVKNDTWYYTIGAPFDYDYAPQSPADISPNCIVKDADLEELYDVEDMVKGFLNRYVYSDNFAENYQIGQTYDLRVADIERTLRKAIAVFLFKFVSFKANASYIVLLTNIETIVAHILSDIGNNKIANFGIFTIGGIIRIDYRYTNSNIPSKRISQRTGDTDYTCYEIQTSIDTDVGKFVYIDSEGVITYRDGITRPISYIGINLSSYNHSLTLSNLGLDL